MKLNCATVKTFWHLIINICDKKKQNLFKLEAYTKPNSNDAVFVYIYSIQSFGSELHSKIKKESNIVY